MYQDNFLKALEKSTREIVNFINSDKFSEINTIIDNLYMSDNVNGCININNANDSARINSGIDIIDYNFHSHVNYGDPHAISTLTLKHYTDGSTYVTIDEYLYPKPESKADNN